MPATFNSLQNYWSSTDAWPTSITLSGPPSGTDRGDRMFLVVLAYDTPVTLDNWNLNGDWDLVAQENGSIGLGVRNSIHVYTARHQDGAPLPVTISPRTSGGTLLSAPSGESWWRAHLFSYGPSYPIYEVSGSPQRDLARGNTTNNQPFDDRAGLSGESGARLVQFTAFLSPEGRTLGAIVNPGGSINDYTLRDTFDAVTDRGGQAKIIDTTSTAAFTTTNVWGLHVVGGAGTPIAARGILIVLDDNPDTELPPLVSSGGIFVDGAVHVFG